ncbi:MAG: hypothetical protein CBB97_22350 [Candidatus Endolissoclinum sp. TMED37]|nr:MAG: hypothetical protein CBB97_22350 [Candidatus Endolissoclinum sp. TMED37]|tara:strand:+ start:1698 stop:1904 length:207 start_codon:yes stop_codon:yes gene_type:complete
MDPITHTIIAGLSLFIAYLWGYRQGARQGALEGMAAVIVFVKQKVGHIQWNLWENEMIEDIENQGKAE